MSDQEQWNGNMPNLLEAVLKPVQEALGALLKMFDPQSSWSNTNTQIRKVLDSRLNVTGLRLPLMHFETDENHDSLLSSPTSERSFTSPKLPFPNSDKAERERDMTLTLHLSVFGSEANLRQTAQRIVRDMLTQKFGVYAASMNGEAVEIPDAL